MSASTKIAAPSTFGATLAALSTPPILALLAALCSIGIQSFDFAINNNLYHIPIVLKFGELPQFQHDAYIQSLKSFVSPVYWLLSYIANEYNIVSLFFAMHLLTRFLTFLALVLIVRECGIRKDQHLIAATAILVVSKAIYGISLVGGDGMLMRFFSHSELAQAVALLAFLYVIRGHLLVATVLSALVFDINAFIGAWALVPVAMACLSYLWRPNPVTAARKRILNVMVLGVTYCLIAGPVLFWIASTVSGQTVDFDYRFYLRYELYGKHFFLDASETRAILLLVGVIIAGVMAIEYMALPHRHWLCLGGLVLVFLSGAVLGSYTQSRFILNLHLIRVDGLLLLLLSAYFVAISIRVFSWSEPIKALAAAAAIAGLMTGFWILPILAVLSLNAERLGLLTAGDRMSRWFSAVGRHQRSLAYVAAAALLAYGSLGAYLARPRLASAQAVPTDMQLVGAWPAAIEWLEVQHWARDNTPEDARFLVPLKPEGFRIIARRVTSGDWKEGSAALWDPTTYRQWSENEKNVSSLRLLNDWIAYACAKGFAYVVFDKRKSREERASDLRPVFGNKYFEVYRVENCDARRGAMNP